MLNMSESQAKRVILDKSFLQAENSKGRRLRLLYDTGATFVLTDTLIYEICSDSEDQWARIQRRLFPFADRLEVWHHVGPLMRDEIQHQRPIQSPVDAEGTRRLQAQFRNQKVFVPENLAEICQAFVQERERTNVDVLIAECRQLCNLDQRYAAAAVKNDPFARQMVAELVQNPRLLEHIIQREHGNAADPEKYIQHVEQGLREEWLAYHSARSLLALYGVFLLKYGLVSQPGKDFRHTRLDADYLALLHFADGLATNESSGSLADMAQWMYCGRKLVFSTGDVDQAAPTHEEVSLKAYLEWTASGNSHGHHLSHWFHAEQQLVSQLWSRLQDLQLKRSSARNS